MAENLSPMMQQYKEIKEKCPDQILFFRLGDFYEMFFEDAVIASRELDLTLTGRDCGQEERAPMCGVPYHSAEAYVARLIKKGYKVAICEQMEDPATAKGVVRREIIRVVTPGTVIESAMLDESANNFIACIFCVDGGYGFAFSDITTGEILACDIRDNPEATLKNELGKLSPSEILFNAAFTDKKEMGEFIRTHLNSTADLLDDGYFDTAQASSRLLDHFHVPSLADLGLEHVPFGVCAAAALLHYVEDTQKVGLDRIMSIQRYSIDQYMNLDVSSRRNLELTETMRGHEKKGSLLWVMDKTKTSMGRRLLRVYIEQPLVNPSVINKRLNAVTELYRETILRQDIRDLLAKVADLERLMTRVVYGSVSPRELKSLEYTAKLLPDLHGKLEAFTSQYLCQVREKLDTLEDIAQLIEQSVIDDPPANLRDGGVLKNGFNGELDELREVLTHSKEYVAAIEAQEREKTGIRNLKIGFNRVFGYYIEVTKSNLSAVPDSYIRKQTLTNCERYITQDLKEIEAKILGAGEKIEVLEAHLYDEIRTTIASQLHRIQGTADAIAKLDVYACFAQVAADNNYCCPVVDFSGEMMIRDGRHPVVERLLQNESFVSNDTTLDQNDNRVAIITGPNMAGKSTFMRQTALIALMAQIGSYVPAKSAKIGAVDGIYTRVGASDDLASGQSTFMVEMSEVAFILKNASEKSLLILDEIGRGTSTFDGMSIARAVLEYIADKKKLGAKTLFATHYHELTELEECVAGVKNYNIAVLKKGRDITFLRRIVPGGTDDSYGIEVSRLAGIPEGVIKRAYAILESLEEGSRVSAPKLARPRETYMDGQLTLSSAADHPAIQRIRSVDVDALTPRDALNILYELRTLVK